MLFRGETLLDRVGRALCEAECLPRKELYESWEVARRVRRRFRGGRVVDLACGHGLSAQLLLLLTDLVLDRAIAAGARVAVLPCCQRLAHGGRDALAGWLDGATAIDVRRAVRLQAAGYSIHTLAIPAAITPKNRLLLGEPRAAP